MIELRNSYNTGWADVLAHTEGKLRVKRKTEKKKFNGAIARMKDWLKRHRNLPITEIVKGVRTRLLGHYRYTEELICESLYHIPKNSAVEIDGIDVKAAEDITTTMEWAETFLRCTRYIIKLRFSGGKCLVTEVGKVI